MIRAAADRPRPRLVEPQDTGPADAAAELKSYLDRIMRLHEERKGLSDDIGEIYKEAKGRGFERKAMVSTVRRLLGDETAFAELDATVDLYLRAYRGTGTEHANAHVPAPAQPLTPHNPDTGEIIEASATVADRDAETVPPAAGGSPAPAAPVDDEADLYQRAVAIVVEGQKASTAYVQRLLGIGYNKAVGLMERMEAEGIVSRSDVGGRRTVLIEQNPKPGAGVESMGNGGQAEPAETMLEPNLGYAAGRTAEEDVASPEGGRPSALPIQVHKTIGGGPLTPAVDPTDLDAVCRARQSAMPDIPDRFRRAPVAGNG